MNIIYLKLKGRDYLDEDNKKVLCRKFVRKYFGITASRIEVTLANRRFKNAFSIQLEWEIYKTAAGTPRCKCRYIAAGKRLSLHPGLITILLLIEAKNRVYGTIRAA